MAGMPTDAAVRQLIGAELRRLRLRAGLTQEDVARAMSSHRPIVGRNERGRHATSLAMIDAQARACGGSLAHVLCAYDVAMGTLPAGGGRG